MRAYALSALMRAYASLSALFVAILYRHTHHSRLAVHTKPLLQATHSQRSPLSRLNVFFHTLATAAVREAAPPSYTHNALSTLVPTR